MKQASALVSIKAALFGAALILAACSSPNRVSEAAELLISVQNGEAVVTPVLEGDVLWLGQTRIEPWLESAPDCSACQLRIERRHSPVGPDIILSLYQSGQLRWRLIDSRQPKLRLPDNSLIEHQGSYVQWSRGEESIDLNESQTLTWQGCQQHLAWLAKHAAESSKNVVPEASATRWQLITNCS
ncbi:hypothetical protein BGP77_03145 [Saccharospirillum sp. MSK14-1]|uniref:hypothetical protein n=1 Tax=Saccharospirillum sp. MSK14-1 TaxID=1897632 RepID=UPI000D3BD122|nr:hypothetical protein [Saccharospirillum sp. MSK14-1]PTY36319.1 hypothetical protein BGP77_03145 [Saccharospirillum sp. MSK14-1]